MERETGNARPETAAECPFCREAVQPAARKCPHCQEYLDPSLAPRRAGASPYAIAAFILGIISPFFCCFPGPMAALLGIIALLHRREPKGRWMAIAGLVLGILWTVLVLLVILSIATHICNPQMPRGLQSSPAEPLF